MSELKRWSADEVAVLEQEVGGAERRLALLKASIRAAAAEVEAARDSRQFDRNAFRTWWGGRQPNPGDREALLGLAAGAGTGVSISLLLSFLMKLWAG